MLKGVPKKRPQYPRVFRANAAVLLERVGQWALERRANHVLIIVAGHIDEHAGEQYLGACRDAEAMFGDDLLERFEADAWPVTQLFGKTNTAFVSRFSPAVLDRMVRAEPDLGRWHYPHPEDVCFFRAGAPMPLFASVTHENEAYYFAREAPPFAGEAELADGIGPSVPLGRYFCSVPKP